MLRIMRIAAVAVALIALFALPAAASAHEHREVGEYEFVVGFLNEPAYENEQNGIWVSVAEHGSGKPVEGLADTLKAQVLVGSQTRDMELRPAWGEKGVYISNFYPTAAGDYTFRFVGEINGTPVDETFTSSPDGFDGVKSVQALQFPAQVSSNAQLESQIRTAQILGAAGLAVGVAGLIVAALALRARRAVPVSASRPVPREA